MDGPDTAARQPIEGFYVWRLEPPPNSSAVTIRPVEQLNVLPSPLSPPSLSPPTPALPVQSTTQLLVDAQSAPQTCPTRFRWQSPSSHPQPTLSPPGNSGPQSPLIFPPTNAMHEPILASLRTLQAQFSVFQESFEAVRSDVKDALSQLHALRTSQNKTNRSITELENVIGVSSTGTSSRGRGKRGRGRGRGRRIGTHVGSPIDVEDADAEFVPEKTLVQNITLIQSAIQELLAHQHPISSDTGSTRPCASSVNPVRQGSSPTRSVADPLRSVLQLFQVAASPPAPTLDLETSPPSTGKGTQYANASVQAYPLSPTSPSSESSCSSQAPTFTTVDWNLRSATVERNPNDLAPPSVHIADLARENQNDDEANTATVGQTCRSGHDCSTALHSSVPFCPDESAVIVSRSAADLSATTNNTCSITEARQTPASVIVQALPLQTPETIREGVDSAMASPELDLPGDLPTSFTSLDVSISTPTIGSGHHEQVESGTEDTQVDLEVEKGQVSVTGREKTVSEYEPTVPEHCREPSPAEPNDKEGLMSSLPTPPSESIVEGREPQSISGATHEDEVEADSERLPRAHLPRSLPGISAPPCSITEPSGGDEREALTGTDRTCLEQLSPLTPTLLYPSDTDNSVSEDDGRNVGGEAPALDACTSFRTNDVDTAIVCGDKAPEGGGSDTPASGEERSSSLKDRAGVDGLLTATDSGSYVHSQVISVSNEAWQSNVESSERYPKGDTDQAYSQTDGGCLGLSMSPLPQAALQFASLSDRGDHIPTPDEDEVLIELMLDASCVSTPVQGAGSLAAPRIWSRSVSRLPTSSADPLSAQRLYGSVLTTTHARGDHTDGRPSTSPPQLLAVDPLMLHDPSCEMVLETQNSPTFSERTLTPLTPLDDLSDVGDPFGASPNNDNDAARPKKKPCIGSPVDRARSCSPVQRPSTLTGGRVVGGPSASLDELALLARREPLKLRVRLAERVQNLKRKRDAMDVEEEQVARESEGARGKQDRPGPDHSMLHQETAPTEGSTQGFFTHVGTTSPASGIPLQITPRLFLGSSTTEGVVVGAVKPPPPRKKVKRQGLSTKKASKLVHTTSEHVGKHQKKIKREPKAIHKSPVGYRVRDGQLVTIELKPRTVATAPSKSQPSARAQGAKPLAPPRTRHQVRLEAPFSSPPRKSRQSSPHKQRFAMSSPLRGEMGNVHEEMWAERPSVLSHWDAQFIQCDNCDWWYHYGCVGIKSEDPRLAPEATFVCPMCVTRSSRRKASRNHDDGCARPDCPEPQVTENTELFFVEKLVGRKRVEGYMYMWLAKWEGYPMSDASWIPKENVVGDDTKLFEAFIEDAAAEGANLSRDLVLLQEAIGAGWDAR